MSQPLTEAAIEAIARNPNVTAAIERLATCYAESMHQATRTNATIRAEDEVLSRVGKAVWFCVHDATTGGARGEAPKAAPVTPRRTDQMTVEEMAGALGLSRDSHGSWRDGDGAFACDRGFGWWLSCPNGGHVATMDSHSSEHAALSRLYALRFPETTGTPATAPIVEPGADTARESATLEAEPEGARERWRFTVALAVVVDGRACFEFQRRITESALVALLTPRADRGDVLALARDCDDMERHCAYDRRTGRPFAFIERVA